MTIELRLRALVAIGARDAERGDARVAEGENDVARRDFAHGLVEGTAGFGNVTLVRSWEVSIMNRYAFN